MDVCVPKSFPHSVIHGSEGFVVRRVTNPSPQMGHLRLTVSDQWGTEPGLMALPRLAL